VNQFYVGQKVVCIDAKFQHVSIDQGISEGEIYTLSWVGPYVHYVDGEFIGVRLAEVTRGDDPGGYGADEMPFRATRFRPLVADRLGSLRALLVPDQPLAPAPEEPRRRAPVKEEEKV
jgi:hypothetical protein